MAQGAPLTVVEMPEFLAVSRKLMDEAERSSLVLFLAFNPEAGDLVPGAGGVRKLRWSLEGRGKRGGARVIYYFHSERIPLFIITAYAKNARDDISDADRNDMKQLVKVLGKKRGTKE
jgi:mRNA-degrading endonuclease RelE of RelBE toxin-antitoxin system